MHEQPRTANAALPSAPARWAWLAGAGAGLWVALADYGAIWLWLPVWRDRGSLLLRSVALLVPLGALAALLATWLGAAGFRLARRRPERAALRFSALITLLAAPLLRLLAVKLCSGGMMSRLPQHALVEWGVTTALLLLTYLTLWVGCETLLRVQQGRLAGTRVAVALLLASFAAQKTNQTVLPNLYDYLHGALALLGFALATFGLALLGQHFSPLQGVRKALTGRAGLTLAPPILVLVLAVDVLTLDANLNVRVAMFDPRAPVSRAVLAVANPLLRGLEQPRRSAARARVPRGSSGSSDLTTHPGAHVLLVTIDALRADHVGAYGYQRAVSPGLDALARSGWMFRRAYAQAPHSSYSLSSLHTSEYLHEVVELGRPLPRATLASALRERGYHTAAFFTDGVFHTEGHKLAVYRDSAFGFALFDHTNRESEDQTDRVFAEVERIRAEGEPPSLLWVHYFDVHEPYQETHFGSGDLDRYDSEIRHVDRELARLIAGLSERLSRPLVIAISADHGEEFREHGGVYHGSTLFDEQVRVPLLFRIPGQAPSVVEAPVEVIDIAPTLLGLVGVEAPASMRGRDLRSLAAQRATEPRVVFSAVLTKRMALRWPHKLIADLRFGLFELYDLERDPGERRNLAQRDPATLALLRDDVYAWLDSLEERGDAAHGESDRTRALRWGRLGDRRAVQGMGELLLDARAKLAERVEAGQILAKLADESATPALLVGLNAEPEQVAAEAAIALGRMYDERARAALKRLVHTEDPYLRARAAVSLGRLRDPSAVPALIDALWVAPTLYEREEAVRWLGRLRDARAVEPLISLIPEFGMRYLVAVALGEIGDARAFDALVDMLRWEERTNIRDEIVRGLGLLGDARAIDVLIPVLVREPGLKHTAESLVRLNAQGSGQLGGLDVGPALGGKGGLFGCVAGPLRHDWDYLQRTSCRARSGARLSLPIRAAEARLSQGAILIVRARREDAAEVTELSLSLNGRALEAAPLDGNWRELRFEIEPSWLRQGPLLLRLDSTQPGAVFALDHALIAQKLPPHSIAISAPAKPAQDAQRTQ